jgi:D-tyrosyl-tRNA(Tyr) deacylase
MLLTFIWVSISGGGKGRVRSGNTTCLHRYASGHVGLRRKRIQTIECRTMRAVIQRVTEARVEVEGRVSGEIKSGLLVLLGVARDDTEKDADYLAERITNLRIFDDDQGKMNLSIMDVSGEMLVVSQFTLYGDVRRGRRPSYSDAAEPAMANKLYECFVDQVRAFGLKAETGVFQAMMQVSLVNDGPVTILLDSKKLF